jgi:hypothetical protein
VASQVQFGNLQSSVSAGIAVESLKNLKSLSRTQLQTAGVAPLMKAESLAMSTTPQVFAHSVEFVALPGKTEKLVREIPVAMRQANGKFKDFSGCIVLVSEEEARLVTVITLWTERDSSKGPNENLDHLRTLLEPYVDSWLRTRKFISLLSIP